MPISHRRLPRDSWKWLVHQIRRYGLPPWRGLGHIGLATDVVQQDHPLGMMFPKFINQLHISTV